MTPTVLPVCPECESSFVRCASTATVYQQFSWWEGDALDYDGYESDDVEFEGPDRFVCLDCFHTSDSADDFRPEVIA